MDKLKKKLTNEEYEMLKDKTYNEINEWVKEHLSRDILIGYGYYGHNGIKDADGEQYIECYIGSGCD